MESLINVCLMSQQAYNNLTVKGEEDRITELIHSNPNDSSWLKTEISPNDPLYVKKIFSIPDFSLETSEDGDYSKVDFNNSVTLWKALNDLPRYILCDERFWLWIYFEKGYKAALQAMPVDSGTTFRDHWTFSQGKRRGLMFGVLSRCFFRVDLSYDQTLSDPFELSKFAIESPTRFRELTWRNNSNLNSLVKGTLQAEKKYILENGEVPTGTYALLAKDISNVLAVRLADSMTKEDFYQLAYSILEKIVPALKAEKQQ